MEPRYDLIFEGKTSDDCSPEDARRNLAKLLRREPGETEALFSGKPFFLRRVLDPETAYLRRDDGWHIATEEGYQGARPSF